MIAISPTYAALLGTVILWMGGVGFTAIIAAIVYAIWRWRTGGLRAMITSAVREGLTPSADKEQHP